MILNRFLLVCGAVCGVPVHGAPAVAQSSPDAVARRIATASAIALEEYALGVSHGRVVSAAELEEARLFLAEAERLAAQLPSGVRDSAVARLAALVRAVDGLAEAAVLGADVAALRRGLATGLNISLDPLPSRPVRLARGAEIYRTSCAACHGVRGAGDGPGAAGLDPRPADFTDRTALSATSPLDFFRKVNVGVAGTAMAGFEDLLSLEDRWAVALYVSGLRFAGADHDEGRRWLVARCNACLAEVSDPATLLGVSDDSLAALLERRIGEPVPAEAVAFARTAGAADVLGGDPMLAAARVAERVDRLAAAAAALAAEGARSEATGRALEAYLAFESIEREVGARDAGAVTAVERAFGAFRAALTHGDEAAIVATAEEMRDAVAAALTVLGSRTSPAVLFGQSLLIILREGLEAILVLGALAALLVQAGAADRMRHLGIGVGLALLASVGTAVLFATLLRVTVAQQEAIEGVTMLVAAAVLFSVASWMVSKVEAERWQAFIRERLHGAVAGRGMMALAGVAFLAVYREGAETILFYAALLGTADGSGGTAAVAAGFVTGALLLVLVYVVMRTWGVRIPVRPFFAVTGVLLTVMAVSFAGRGVAELQTAGWIPATPVRLPSVPALGLFPTVQTVTAQLIVAVAFLVAVLIVARAPAARPVAVAR